MKSQGRFFLWVVTDSWPSATPAMPRPNNPRVLEKIISKASGKEAGSCRKPGQANPITADGQVSDHGKTPCLESSWASV